MSKTLTGIVVSSKMVNTVVVKIDRYWRHPIYKKGIKRSKKYLVDDRLGVKEGDKVRIAPIRPLSKKKKWKVVEVVK